MRLCWSKSRFNWLNNIHRSESLSVSLSVLKEVQLSTLAEAEVEDAVYNNQLAYFNAFRWHILFPQKIATKLMQCSLELSWLSSIYVTLSIKQVSPVWGTEDYVKHLYTTTNRTDSTKNTANPFIIVSWGVRNYKDAQDWVYIHRLASLPVPSWGSRLDMASCECIDFGLRNNQPADSNYVTCALHLSHTLTTLEWLIYWEFTDYSSRYRSWW